MNNLIEAIKPIIQDANYYFCDGCDWSACKGAPCACKQQAQHAVLQLLLALRKPTDAMIEAGAAQSSVVVDSMARWEVASTWQVMIDTAIREVQDDRT